MLSAGRSAGRMQQQRAHKQGVPRGRGAKDFRLLRTQLLNAIGCKSAQTMRSRQNSERTVGRVGVIEVKPDREHLLQQLHGRLHMRNPLLYGPRSEARHIRPSADGQSQILMPRDEPVCFRRLVKIDGANWSWFSGKMRTHETKESRRARDGCDRKICQQAAASRTRDRSKRSEQLLLLLFIKDLATRREAVSFNFKAHGLLARRRIAKRSQLSSRPAGFQPAR
ncbi:MAG: hypothetical protein JWQ44_1095 [Chthoniobacter sp.]|nr:hypothetical protein [Chthoniobacter sp.]